jgi:diketogulonate reductase-like aldo/keto reductase
MDMMTYAEIPPVVN